MQSNYQSSINGALKDLSETKSVSSALLVCKTLLTYMGAETSAVEDIELTKIRLPNAERYDRWFEAHPHFRGDRACFDLTPAETNLEAKFYSLQKRSKLFIAGSVSFTPNFEDREYTRTDPSMKVGIDFFLPPEKTSVIVALSNKGSLRLVELSGRLTNTQHDIFTLWHDVAHTSDRNVLHTTIWESFKLSSLNKKFYEGISNSFTSLTQHLQSNKVEEQLANQFANRLHGRLLFLWFLRKKHIINEDAGYFNITERDDTEYYAKTLSTLFFDVLNSEDHKAADPVTPYLNGGLFDQDADGQYWKTHNPSFPTGFFKALYDHFDSFNFTTDESTPEYEQIAIDPEMLGRIFESFLATLKTETGAQAKKANGAFYTPREIVGYMSRESLRQYLYTALDANATLKTSIDELLDRPDNEWALAGTNSKRDTVAKEDRERILNALREIRVLDPAVGSGAFPMGVLHKILSLYERLDPSFDSYETKLSILRNNIYGVDIDPTAIEIARLRAWLSVIVDAEDVKKIKPLPNLDFKFVCANTLIGLDTSKQESLMPDPSLKSTLMRIRDEYYATSSKVKKEKLQKEYMKLTHKESLFDSEEVKQLKSYQPFQIGNSTSFYDPELMHGVDTFDVVIGNPPYIRHRDLPKKIKDELKVKFMTGNTTSDIYCYFYELGHNLLGHNGVLSFITSNKWMKAKYGKKLRVFLKENSTLLQIIDLGPNQFASATVDTNILICKKVVSSPDHNVFYGFEVPTLTEPRLLKITQKQLDDDSFTLTDVSSLALKDKIEKLGVPLSKWSQIKINYGVLTGKNEIKTEIGKEGVFIIDKKVRDELVSQDNNSLQIIHPVLRGKDVARYSVNWSSKYIITMYHGSHKIIDDFPAIKKHLYKYKKSLESRAQVIRGDHNWIELDQNPSKKYIEEFAQPKIVYPVISSRAAFTYDDHGFIHNDKVFHIVGKNLLFLVGFLNSKLAYWLIRHYGPSLGEKGFEFRKIFVEKLPVPQIPDAQQKPFIDLVNEIIIAKKSNPEVSTTVLENKIDQLVYKLYDLTSDEINIINDER